MPKKLPENISLEPMPFDEAIEYFDGLVPLTKAEFYAQAEQARETAFMVGGVTRMDIVEGIHQSILKAIADGETLADFQSRVEDIFQAKGLTAPEELTPWRLETIFRANVQTAYSTGRYKQMIEVTDRFPYWEYDAVNDGRTRPTHAALDGKVFPADHAFWDTWYPLNGFNCRCGVNPVHKYSVEEEGLKIETEDPTGTLIEPVDVDGQRLPARLLIPDEGFEHNPAKEVWAPDLKKYPDELGEQFEKERSNR